MEPSPPRQCSPGTPFASRRHLPRGGGPLRGIVYFEAVTDKLGRRVTAKGGRLCSGCTVPTGRPVLWPGAPARPGRAEPRERWWQPRLARTSQRCPCTEPAPGCFRKQPGPREHWQQRRFISPRRGRAADSSHRSAAQRSAALRRRVMLSPARLRPQTPSERLLPKGAKGETSGWCVGSCSQGGATRCGPSGRGSGVPKGCSAPPPSPPPFLLLSSCGGGEVKPSPPAPRRCPARLRSHGTACPQRVESPRGQGPPHQPPHRGRPCCRGRAGCRPPLARCLGTLPLRPWAAPRFGAAVCPRGRREPAGWVPRGGVPGGAPAAGPRRRRW